jgi:hypothetical protein
MLKPSIPPAHAGPDELLYLEHLSCLERDWISGMRTLSESQRWEVRELMLHYHDRQRGAAVSHRWGDGDFLVELSANELGLIAFLRELRDPYCVYAVIRRIESHAAMGCAGEGGDSQ